MELLSIIMLYFTVCFIAFIVGLVFFNVLVMISNSEQSKIAEVNPVIIDNSDLFKLSEEEFYTVPKGLTREKRREWAKENLNNVLDKQKAYLETTPSHKTRVALRKKRKSKQEK